MGDGEGHGGLVYSPWGCKESDMTGQLNNKVGLRFCVSNKPTGDTDGLDLESQGPGCLWVISLIPLLPVFSSTK